MILSWLLVRRAKCLVACKVARGVLGGGRPACFLICRGLDIRLLQERGLELQVVVLCFMLLHE